MAGKYQLRKTSDGQYLFNLKGGNGETILTSERYTSKAGALNGIQAVRVNSPSETNYRKSTSAAGRPYFVLKASNGETLGTSEEYSSTAARDDGIAACKREGPTALVEDLT